MIKETASQEARDEIASRMEHSFGQLTQTVVAKAETINANATTITGPTKALAEMTVACKTLTATNGTLFTALTKCGGKTKIKPPPQFSQNGAGTGHTLNSVGASCPTHIFTNPRTKVKSRVQSFVSQQQCTTCGKK